MDNFFCLSRVSTFTSLVDKSEADCRFEVRKDGEAKIYLFKLFRLALNFNTLTGEISNTKIIIVYLKDFFFRSRIIRNIDYEITT